MGARGKLIEESRYNGLGHRIAYRLDTDLDGDVDEHDNTVNPADPNSSDSVWVDQVYDDSWRIVAVFKQGADADKPHERFVYHNAGMDGRGSSSYIDDVILRERSNARVLSVDAVSTLGDRLYYLQNWRHDVVATVTPLCRIVERTRYTSYGVPTTHTGGDFNHDAQVDDDDFALFVDPYNNFAEVNYAASTARSTGDYSELDLNVDGNIEDGDFGAFAVAYGNFSAAKPGELSHRDVFDPYANVDSRVGYAGYQWSAGTASYHVRFRCFIPARGAWTVRDPILYKGGMDLYEYVTSTPIETTDPKGLCPACDDSGTNPWVPNYDPGMPSLIPVPDFWPTPGGTPGRWIDPHTTTPQSLCKGQMDDMYNNLIKHPLANQSCANSARTNGRQCCDNKTNVCYTSPQTNFPCKDGLNNDYMNCWLSNQAQIKQNTPAPTGGSGGGGSGGGGNYKAIWDALRARCGSKVDQIPPRSSSVCQDLCDCVYGGSAGRPSTKRGAGPALMACNICCNAATSEGGYARCIMGFIK